MKVQPRGWFLKFLETQMDGLTGHIEEAGFPFDREWWGTDVEMIGNDHPNWWEYEQTAYWLDGYTRTAILLERENDIRRASDIIYGVLNHPDEDGYLGPRFLKYTEWGRWPHVVFFRACLALWQYNRDGAILQKLTNHYLGHKADFSRARDVMNVEIMVLLYLQNKERKLLELAEDSYARYNENCTDDNCDRIALLAKKPYAHGVTYNEYSKLGALLYAATGERVYLDVSVAAFEKIDKYFMLPGGCPCSNEFMLGNRFSESYETCDISDYTWSIHYMHAITENGEYGDKTERCIFNAGIGSVLEDFKALQYFSCANQLLADGSSNHNCFFAGKEWMSYRPAPGTQCCPGNVNRFMPNYVLNMWETGENEVRCRLYGASRMETQLGGGKVIIEEETDYPFNEQIVFNVSADVPFIFKLRIPKWTTAFYLTVNGEPMQCYPDNGYVRVPIEGNAELCMRFKSVVEKHLNHGGIYFVKGPLVYALGGKERRVAQIQKGKRFPSYDIYADFEWRYAVDEECETEFCEGKSADITARNEMPHIALTARRIEGWDFEKPKYVQRCIDLYKKQYEYVRGDFVFTPRFLPAVHGGVKEKIVLYPYGVQKMRLTVFPCKRILESKPEDK